MQKDLSAAIPSELTFDRLQRLLRFFRKGLPVMIAQERQTAGYLLRRVGLPTGEPPQHFWPGRLRFDCADAPVETRHPSQLERTLYRATGMDTTSRPTGTPIPPASILLADQNADSIAQMAALSPSVPVATRNS